MTLRELIHAVMDTGNWNKVTSIIYDTYYTENDDRRDVDHVYMSVLAELLELAANKTDDQIIIENNVSLIPGEDDQSTIEKYIDVLILDDTGQTYSTCYVDWCDLIDSTIVSDLELDMNEQLAHVLWEITFHGFSNESVTQSREELQRQIDSIESGDEKLIEWSEVQDWIENEQTHDK